MKTAIFTFLLIALLSGCSHKPVPVAVPEAPAPTGEQQSSTESANTKPQDNAPVSALPANARPLWSETGIASWYGAPYHNRRASNGEVYDMHAMTAAHRTLPLGSIVRVTNIENGDSAVVRITDRGPFIEGRIVDLSQAAAKKVGLVQK